MEVQTVPGAKRFARSVGGSGSRSKREDFAESALVCDWRHMTSAHVVNNKKTLRIRFLLTGVHAHT
jgi:hypothetical protein